MPEMGDKLAEMTRLREASGSVDIDSRLVGFLYILMRDYVPPGHIEEILLNHTLVSHSQYTNGWLARYAEDIAKRLTER